MIGIIDYGAGNVRSIELAFERLGYSTLRTANKGLLGACDHLIFPGVGHAKSAKENLEKSGVLPFLKEATQPVLGICLGMQLMCQSTEEGEVEGLGIFETKVKRFREAERIPHMGWNSVAFNGSPLFKGIKPESDFYFVHAYYAEESPDTIAKSVYPKPFTAALAKSNFYGVQFHPERSGKAGQQLIQNFLAL
ncbi:imidazole glycerol phosphate synthase subunit HisH [Sanyastnella coralliicola]|uniref:imidazole glycerol phosphate synthase subunit HisH n=1 Tax=Sanyastnella coralliicola TaxID=3069118 RepID=UPI0027BA6382|nr:imidazole glycerol phosphate synthase subunit HisH [Longitalea sp. SCSIO 12813]